MRKLAAGLSWVMLALFGIAILLMAVRFPNYSAAGGVIGILPFATALIAYKSTLTCRPIFGPFDS